MKLKFRKANDNDKENVLNLEKMASNNKIYFPLIEKNKFNEYFINNTLFIIEKNKENVGVISYRVTRGNKAYIENLNIHKKHRKKGIGKKAVKFALKKLKNCTSVSFHTHPHNTAALKISLDLGFKIKSWTDDYYGDGEPRLLIEKESD